MSCYHRRYMGGNRTFAQHEVKRHEDEVIWHEVVLPRGRISTTQYGSEVRAHQEERCETDHTVDAHTPGQHCTAPRSTATYLVSPPVLMA